MGLTPSGRIISPQWLQKQGNLSRDSIGKVSIWGGLGRVAKVTSGGYLLKADGQQLSHKVGPFTQRDGDSCKPVGEKKHQKISGFIKVVWCSSYDPRHLH